MTDTASCYVNGQHVSGLPLIKKNRRTVKVLVRDGQSGRIKQITRRIGRHKVRIHSSFKKEVQK